MQNLPARDWLAANLAREGERVGPAIGWVHRRGGLQDFVDLGVGQALDER